jgi:hypothetical protein
MMTKTNTSSQEQDKEVCMTKKDRKKAIEAIKTAHGRLMAALDNITWNHIYSDYFNANIKEEKKHDNFRHDSIRRGISIYEAGQLFAVKQIVEFYLRKDEHGNKVKKPDVKDFLSIRKTIYEAYAITETYRPRIKQALKGLDLEYIQSLDYCELIK